MLVSLHDQTTRPIGVAKRALDVSVAAVALVVAAPVIAVAALAVAIETPGSPFFVQRRVGRHGALFPMVKLRGMYIDARQRFPELYDYSAKRSLDFFFHVEADPRVTRVGRWLRKTSIDELPNFINVLRGEMSLVGPRPEVPEVMALYGPYYAEYLSVLPGITCLSKCTGRDRLSKRETVEMDIGYVRRRTFALDLRILWDTARNVLGMKDVH